MKALVTGGAGFIGSNLVRLLREHDHKVVVLDNLLSGYHRNIEGIHDVHFIEGDVRDRETVRRAMRDIDVVFHLAASVGNKRSIDHPDVDAGINVMGTVEVMEAARIAGVRRLVISSSAGIFGELKTLPIAEDHPIEPDTPYGSSKLFKEKFCLSYAKLYAMGVVCLRYFNVYGPHQRYDAYGNVIPIFAYRMLRGEPLYVFGDGEQTRDFVNVRDVAQANLAAALAEGVTGAFNLGSGNRVTINDLIGLLETAAGTRANVVYTDPRHGDVRHSLADIRSAAMNFGFSPSTLLQEGLAEYMAWLRAEENSHGRA